MKLMTVEQAKAVGDAVNKIPGQAIEKDMYKSASAVLDKCKKDAACYLGVLDTPVPSAPPAAKMGHVKAVWMAVELHPAGTKEKLLERVEKVKDGSVRLAILEGIDTLSPNGDAAAADKLEKLVEADRAAGNAAGTRRDVPHRPEAPVARAVIRLEVTRGQLVGTAIEPTSDIVRIGRAEGNDLVVPDTHVSSEHAKIVFSADRYVLVDQRSTNGTAILRGGAENGAEPARIALDDTNSREATLEDGDVIELGSQDRIVHVVVSMREDADDARVFAMKKIEELVPRATILEKDEGRLRVLYDALKRIGGAQDLSEVLVAICESSFTLVPLATHVTIILRDDDEDSAAARGASGYVPVMTRVRGQDAPPSQAIPITRSVFRKVVSERAAVVAADAPRDVGQSESLMGAQIRSTLGIPLWKGEEILGVIQVDNREATGVLTASDLDIMAVLAQNASLAVANARVAKRLRAAEDRLKKENAFLKGKEQERRTGGKKDGAPEIIGNSAPMKQLLQQLEKVVNTRVTVLIEGETGVGKELVAASVHYRSNRRERLFVGQNCAAMPETLLESELFGHKKGAFTGAHEDKRGLFEVADGGTLFLDEVTEMPLSLQSKLLRVLQEGEIRADRRDAGEEGQRPHRRRDEPQPREGGRRGPLPRGPLLPPQGLPSPRPAAPRAPRRHPAHRLALPPALRDGVRQAGRRLLAASDGAPPELRLAGQRPRAPERDPAPRHPNRHRRLRHPRHALAARPPGRRHDRARPPHEGHAQGDDGPGRALAPHRSPPRARQQQDRRREVPRHHPRGPPQEAPRVRAVSVGSSRRAQAGFGWPGSESAAAADARDAHA